jgi:molybdopterin-guanine dinucleotide biosynthesis protein A
MRVFLETLEVNSVAFPMLDTVAGPLDPFFNINRPADLATALHHIAGEKNP